MLLQKFRLGALKYWVDANKKGLFPALAD
jgi:hypothetical protein